MHCFLSIRSIRSYHWGSLSYIHPKPTSLHAGSSEFPLSDQCLIHTRSKRDVLPCKEQLFHTTLPIAHVDTPKLVKLLRIKFRLWADSISQHKISNEFLLRLYKLVPFLKYKVAVLSILRAVQTENQNSHLVGISHPAEILRFRVTLHARQFFSTLFYLNSARFSYAGMS